MPEPTLRCPGCGAPAGADDAACAYCGSALATVTCPSCFAAMFVGSRFCAHCGAEATRELLDDATPLSCPRCRETMQALRLGATSARECGACGGLWLDPLSLQRLADAREEHGNVSSILSGRMPSNTTPTDVVRYIPCPSCGKLMNRTNFAHSSGVILDVCKTHGVWLDRGELQRVLCFVEGGGLAVEREHERERLATERRRLSALLDHPDRAAMYGGSSITVRNEIRINDESSAALMSRFLLDALGAIHK
jgi:Zn-finger nucleic acid-binding protein